MRVFSDPPRSTAGFRFGKSNAARPRGRDTLAPRFCQCRRPAIMRCSTSHRSSSKPIAMRLPILRDLRTRLPSTSRAADRPCAAETGSPHGSSQASAREFASPALRYRRRCPGVRARGIIPWYTPAPGLAFLSKVAINWDIKLAASPRLSFRVNVWNSNEDRPVYLLAIHGSRCGWDSCRARPEIRPASDVGAARDREVFHPGISGLGGHRRQRLDFQ